MKVGILILSHSDLIAEGLLETCNQMVHGVDIKAVGGTGDSRIGIDTQRALEVLEELLKNNDSVVVYADIGSTVLAARSLKNASSEPENVYIADAPLVEGSIAGSVQAMIGGDIETILEESRNSCFVEKA